MSRYKVAMERKELSLEELELARILSFNLPHFTLKTLAKSVYSTEEQVREYLGNLGLSDLITTERIAERRRIDMLGRKFHADLVRATKERLQSTESPSQKYSSVELIESRIGRSSPNDPWWLS